MCIPPHSQGCALGYDSAARWASSLLTLTLLSLLFISAPAICDAAERPAGPNSPLAARGLVERLLPGKVDCFTFRVIPAAEGRDVFEIEGGGNRVVIRGNTGVAMATGLNWYLKNYCCCHVSWCGRQLELPQPLPEVSPKLRRVTWAKHRYFLNYCCFGYSLPWWDWQQWDWQQWDWQQWDWQQWEKLIDWMAINGINAPLSVTGQEAVWQTVCKKLGMISGFYLRRWEWYLPGIDPSFPWHDFSDHTGVVYVCSMVAIAQVRDGTSNTYMVGEKFINSDDYTSGKDPGDNHDMYIGHNNDCVRWTEYDPAAPQNAGTARQDRPGAVDSYRFGGTHSGGCQFVFCDGSVHSISYSIDPVTNHRLGNRRDGEPIDAGKL